MNTKNNKRKQESTARITEAFMFYLENNDLSKIKVSDICKYAGINRSTFYASYEDVYDLAKKIQHNLEQEVNKLFEDDVNWNHSDESFLRLFRHISKNQKLYRTFFKIGYENPNLTFFDICKYRDEHLLPNLEYHVIFFKNGFNAIVKQWLNNGCDLSPEEMCRILLSEYLGRLINDALT